METPPRLSAATLKAAEQLLDKGWLPAHQAGYVCSSDDIRTVPTDTWSAMHAVLAARGRDPE